MDTALRQIRRSHCSLNDPAAAAKYGLWRPYMAPLTCNTRLTSPQHFQDTRHMEFDLAGSGIQYAPGDLLTIFPRQSSEALSAFCKRMHLDPDSWVRIEAADPNHSHCVPMQVWPMLHEHTAYASISCITCETWLAARHAHYMACHRPKLPYICKRPLLLLSNHTVCHPLPEIYAHM